MGKFYDALKRSGVTPEQPLDKPPPKVVGPAKTGSSKLRKHSKTDPEPSAESLLAPDGQTTDPRLVCMLEPNSPEAECFKMLRTKLLLASREQPLRLVMVTSAEPLDGKTLVASNLAVSVAQGINDYVLLVDSDLRAPSVHRMFHLNASPGIHEYLREGTSVAPFLVKTNLQKLTLLLGGKPSQNPSELLCSRKMRLLVDELKSRYEDRYIIFDCPPGKFTAETAFLAGMMDAVILVVRYGKTPRDLILETIENIGLTRLLGVVFNASVERQKDYRYYYRYYRRRDK